MTPEESLQRASEVVKAVVASRHDRPSLVSEIACGIGSEIIEGLLLPNADLNSVELARRFSMSRTPIREALMLLEKEGLVDIAPRRRPRVATYDLDEVREMYETRALLQEQLAIDVVRRAREEELQHLSRVLESMRGAADASDVGGYLWANIDFHSTITEIGRNQTIKRIVHSLLLRTLRLRRLSLSQPRRITESLEDHRRIAAALQGRDARLAAALLRSNHLSALALLERVLPESGLVQ